MKNLDWESRYIRWGLRPRDLERGYSNSRILDVLRPHVAADRALRVLEVGCAPGRWLAWIADGWPIEVVGIDLNGPGLQLSRRVCPYCKLARADAAHLPFADETFDVVFSLGVIEHFEDPGPLLAEQRRLLRYGGTVIVSVPNIGPRTAQGWHWRHFKADLFAAHVAYTPARLTHVLTQSGFSELAIAQVGIYLPRMQRVIKRLAPASLLHRLESPWLASNLIAAGRRG